MTPEQQCEVVAAALAEGGSPNHPVRWDAERGVEIMPILGTEAIAWRALAVTDGVVGGPGLFCWPCWRDYLPTCDHDFRTEPWPELERHVATQ